MKDVSQYNCPLCGAKLMLEDDGANRFVISCPDSECDAEARAGAIGETEGEAYARLLHRLREGRTPH